MNDWGPWINDRLPENGQYVQVHCHRKSNHLDTTIFEGFFEATNDYYWGRILGDYYDDHWVAMKWRALRPREFNPPVKRAQEREEA